MNVKDNTGRKVQVHDRRCPRKICYNPLLMAMVGSLEFWQCGWWDGNEEPCPGKIPNTMKYCGECKAVTINCFTMERICERFNRVLTRKGKKFLKCSLCRFETVLKWEKKNNK